LTPVGRRLAALGVTGVTDATPSSETGALDLLAAARRRGELPQRVMAMGGVALAETAFPSELGRGPVKVVISDHELPSIDDLVRAFTTAHRAGRPVAVHCVTRVAAVLALAAWAEVGALAGDRIEHGSVLPVELLATIAELGLTVVTQPGFVHARGERYRAEVEPDDHPHLYRCGSLLAAGIGVGGSTDAPFGPDDPWHAMAAMVERATASGRPLGPGEAVSAASALARFLSPLDDPGGPPRSIATGQPADLVLVDRPVSQLGRELSAVRVQATWVGGRRAHGDLGC
jgi:predicted amidohydrolase YtcJ